VPLDEHSCLLPFCTDLCLLLLNQGSPKFESLPRQHTGNLLSHKGGGEGGGGGTWKGAECSAVEVVMFFSVPPLASWDRA